MRIIYVSLFLSSWPSFSWAQYLAPSAEHVAEVRDAGLACLKKSAPEKGLIAKYSAIEGRYGVEAPKVGSSEFQKYYLKFKKLKKFCELKKLAELNAPSLKGRYNEESPILGVRANERLELERAAKDNSAIYRFANSLYNNSAACPGKGQGPNPTAIFNMIPLSQKAKATEAARKKLEAYARTKGLSRDLLYQESDFRSGVTYTNEVDNEFNDWNLQVLVDPAGVSTEAGFFLPAEIVALHELGHVERGLPGESESSEQCTSVIHELGPTLQQIIDTDDVYREINKIPAASNVSYGVKVPGNKGDVGLGLVASTFRKLKAKYGSIEKAILSPEGQEFIKQNYDSSPPCQPSEDPKMEFEEEGARAEE